MDKQPRPKTEEGFEVLRTHLGEDVLEHYAMGDLSEELLPQVEEHLLGCSTCQSQLVDIDEFLRLFRIAGTHLEVDSPPLWKRIRAFQPARWAAAAALLTLLLLFVQVSRRNGDTTVAIVTMQSLRGADVGAHVSAGQVAVLMFDLPSPDTSTESADYRVQILNPAGAKVAEAGTSVRNGKLAAPIKRLARGDYWVRLYRADNNKLIAEYGLRAD
jgi:hypothetical protein